MHHIGRSWRVGQIKPPRTDDHVPSDRPDRDHTKDHGDALYELTDGHEAVREDASTPVRTPESVTIEVYPTLVTSAP